ncbi:Dam family site-specific DNA-(adenine-N6)-methyltransferase [Pectobacterium aroidearum]|uniref:Site-specific DNA-methyltransferase (adenine-specific) n=1 Tax=Pectobacterium aroidearum TaxID=1201031 RepID=A0ABR5Z822_9GAMM|nr:Dam family site-specific DNA-(adenine-N6)-methyltransferase [Pectobacterium aroidearum]MBA5197916.1 Dam family site-specific DNA-(adenine-N6)-methyltransferase [Pectobacterium aroidearum]MBA5230709.1 Dam family site-specific DNA-(adenine-N6)-methyltransferase [Pectobacterium aroidearum]
MIRPFIKWPGGKSRVLPDLLPLLPKGDRLFEPFVGGASVFLNTDFPRYVLADINADLINTYQIAQEATQIFIRTARELFENGNSSAEYYRNRKTFNAIHDDERLLKAALFLYLNRHCFNGICRYNNAGFFNVPFGNYKKPYFPEAEIRLFAEKANDTTTCFIAEDFRKVLAAKAINENSVIYCDPPYLPASDTANFTQYHHAAFTREHHHDLAGVLLNLNRSRGVPVVISNSDTPATREIYQHYQFHEIAVQRSISASGITRGAAKEVIGVLKTCDGCGRAGGEAF